MTVTFGSAIQVARLQGMTTSQLRVRFMELFERKPATNNRSYLLKRLALKVQEPGGKALEGGKKGSGDPAPAPSETRLRDPRLPGVGSVLSRSYKGRDLKVVVNERDFTFEGQAFRSLSAIARRVTGVAWNGFLFFGLIPNSSVTA